MKVDMTITLSIIIAVCAIVSPILTTMLNNRHQFDIKKLEINAQNKKESLFYEREIYEQYLKWASNLQSAPTDENLNYYYKYYSLAIIYFPENLLDAVYTIQNHVESECYDNIKQQLIIITRKIREIVYILNLTAPCTFSNHLQYIIPGFRRYFQ